MSIEEMKGYLGLCLRGKSSIPERKKLLEAKRLSIENQIKELKESIA